MRKDDLKETYPGSWVYEVEDNPGHFIVQFYAPSLFSVHLIDQNNNGYRVSILCNGKNFNEFKNKKNRQYTVQNSEDLKYLLILLCVKYYEQYWSDDYALNLNGIQLEDVAKKLLDK